ncbi:Asp-tRNAAsn/Glu-tRNAGln amidotransferase A subunit [Algoriphagus alkaliphilus]|uniref:Asp-tRNAAsn/Glu-tRNAGln amidotransferase A subunit n=1 Tax=Algoriphagus alkaliphilus TaxID=279824 RepID=A0A1G5UZ78_9BACT|nr:amidase family protein [Algoriphagus alkaliphilus]MBA4300717.1 amidase [Cyclobacterium sp.]SDA38678.1 Asp-tRNAAsn/Glu-tRNAGln amidotransferase A subunit [Algoriphagus alkaliphilus]
MNRLVAFLILSLAWACQAPLKEPIILEELTISEIHQAFQNGDFSAEDLVEAYLSRIEALDSSLNSISVTNPEALPTAKKLDAEFSKTRKLRPLHGIPLIVKDNINTKGLPTTAGALALADFYPEEDAFIIQKLVAAGAIVIAKSNMAEWAFSPMHSESSTQGTTRNPYNLDHVPAGSSGGTGAAVAANFGTIGLGTDTGNSIRGPSSHHALVGFRTTLGLVSREGIVPLYLRNDVVGPMCRTVEDATKVLQAIAGIDPKDPITHYSQGKTTTNYTQFLKKDGMKGARIGVFRTLSEKDTDPEISALFNQSLKDMAMLGAVIIDSVEVENFDSLRRNQWCPVFRQDLEKFLADYVKRDTMKTLEDVIRVGTKSEYAKEGLESFRESELPENMVEDCGDPFTDLRRIAFREAIEKVMDSLKLDALVYPSWNNKPARIDRFQEEYLGDNSQIIAPHTGQPAFTITMGFTSGNLPAGLQFLGKMWTEPTLIRLVYSYEQGTKHRKAPVF